MLFPLRLPLPDTPLPLLDWNGIATRPRESTYPTNDSGIEGVGELNRTVESFTTYTLQAFKFAFLILIIFAKLNEENKNRQTEV